MKVFSLFSSGLVLLAFSAITQAAPTTANFDFTSLAGGNPYLNTSETVNGITATGYKFSGGISNPQAAHLYIRNDRDDHGLGVCSEGETTCKNHGGDINEVDNADDYEAILLDKGAGGHNWANLFVSSLDNNSNASGSDVENGTLFWGDSLDPTNLSGHSFTFSYGDFGTDVEGDVLSLSQASGFDPTARYVAFAAGDCLPGGCGTDINNDYLVWKGSVTDVPEPSVLAMFGMGLLVVGSLLRRKPARA